MKTLNQAFHEVIGLHFLVIQLQLTCRESIFCGFSKSMNNSVSHFKLILSLSFPQAWNSQHLLLVKIMHPIKSILIWEPHGCTKGPEHSCKN